MLVSYPVPLQPVLHLAVAEVGFQRLTKSDPFGWRMPSCPELQHHKFTPSYKFARHYVCVQGYPACFFRSTLPHGGNVVHPLGKQNPTTTWCSKAT
eukprot:349627-Chlamydomonas_euryale.AAC.4